MYSCAREKDRHTWLMKLCVYVRGDAEYYVHSRRFSCGVDYLYV